MFVNHMRFPSLKGRHQTGPGWGEFLFSFSRGLGNELSATLKKMAEAVVVNSIGPYANSELHAVRQESKEKGIDEK